MKTTQTLLLSTALLVTATANAALIGSADGQTVYDTDLNITWLANANLAATETFGLARNVYLGYVADVNTSNNGVVYSSSYIYSDGSMTWGGAQQWINAMNTNNYLGHNDWRLPTTPAGACGGINCTDSEMAHLFYSEFGVAPYGTLSGSLDPDLALFSNLQPSEAFWSGTGFSTIPGYAYFFNFNIGFQSATSKSYYNFHSMAVRDGQVAPVPVPTALWLLGSGLLGLFGIARRKAA